jgi:hypothetical protein
VIRGEKPSRFKARGYDRIGKTIEATEVEVMNHDSKSLKSPMSDPFISTTTDINIAKEHAIATNPTKEGCVYYLDSEKITEKNFDVAEVYRNANKPNGYAREKEKSVTKFIPWAAVVKIECHDPNTKTWKDTPLDVKKPAKETPEAGSSSKPGKGKQDPTKAGSSRQHPGSGTKPEPKPEAKPESEQEPAKADSSKAGIASSTKPDPKQQPAKG